MPGLSQLKQFSSDILSLGDEIATRASRGEQPVKVKIPQSVQDINDSDEFVVGMPEIEAEVVDDNVDEDLSDLADIASPDGESSESAEDVAPAFEAPDMSDLLNPLENMDTSSGDMPDLSMFADEPAEPAEEEIIEEEPEEVSVADMGLDALLAGAGFDEPQEETEEPESDFDLGSNIDTGNAAGIDSESSDFENPVAEADSFGLDDLDSFGSNSNNQDIENIEPLEELGSLDSLEPLDEVSDTDSGNQADNSFDNFDAGIDNLDEPAATENFEEPAASDTSAQVSTDDFNFDLPDDFGNEENLNFDEPTAAENQSEAEESSTIEEPAVEEQSATEPEKFEDLADLGNLDDLPDLNDSTLKEPDADLSLDENLSGDTGSESPFDNIDSNISEDNQNADNPVSADFPDLDFTAKDDIPDFDDFGSISESAENTDNGESKNEPIEIFDTSEMEGLDFDIPDTDTQLSNNDSDNVDFNVGSADDFGMESEFEIPGFSDVDTVKEQKSAKINLTPQKNKKHKRIPGGSKESYEDEQNLPPNTLSERQYKIFRKNLNEYPLNVRLAFEDFLVQDEFTDDAEFEVIEKILNKAPARQVASTLEKMLDTSIPVPRDFEHRSADEYESYKKSISYQLKNRIIPALIVATLGVFICIGLYFFGKNCIYRPLKANSLYKQGYALLQETEYPLSEIKFNEAVSYGYNKKWFFKYARGYREHKQYQRAAKMYKNILYCFKHDKEAGLEYADMELDDLADYAKAEEIVRREVLDYHINDKDGILKLGDVFLEWGTEKDPSKLELAREQYATLIQLYGQTDLYLSRMMRYFIRTDNLREVLILKQRFEPKEKSLCSDDWTELSGYLLDKYYGELSPSEEYLRYEIEGLRGLLLRAVKTNPENPIAYYNLGRYFINTNETENIEFALQNSIENFNAAKSMKNRDIYKYIDAYRLLGEHYIKTEDFLQAQEQFSEGISLYITERDNAGFEGTPQVGKIYEDMGDLKYTVSGDYDDALANYNYSVNLGNDSPKIRYRMGYIHYNDKNYGEALGSFMKAGDGNIKERNLLLAMANTLSMRNDDYAAEGYYNQLLEKLDSEIAERGLVLPQANIKDYNIVNTYLCAANNYGVTLYRLARRTGDSSKNAEAIVQFSSSQRAWDALTRNPETLVRMEGSNLAEQNIKYITHSIPEYEPAIYTEISKTLLDNEKF